MLTDAQQKYTRAKELAAKQLLPQSDLDAAKIAVDSAEASLASAQATVTQTQAAVSQSQATVNQNQVNLDHTTIEAPIDGIIIQRSVDVGQTVAASMQAPTLFIIAADLTKMQVNANIDEADVGRIRPGQHVTFKVDAYPTDTFEGTVVADPPAAGRRPERDHLRHGDRRAERAAEAQAGHDGEREGGNREAKRRAARAERGAALPADRPTCSRRSTSRCRPKRWRPAAAADAAARGRRTRAASTAPAPAPPPAPPAPAAGAPRGEDRRRRGGRRRLRSGGAGTAGPGRHGAAAARRARRRRRRRRRRGFDPARMMERFKAHAARRTEAVHRADEGSRQRHQPVREAASRGGEGRAAKARRQATARARRRSTRCSRRCRPSRRAGRAWLFMNQELKPVNLRLGITDGTNTELLSGELQPGMEVVTGVTA